MSLKQALDLGGHKAIVTGGSRGLGLQIAEALGEMGAEVLLAARKQDELDEAVAHLAKMGVKAHAVAADLGKPESVHAFADAALAKLGVAPWQPLAQGERQLHGPSVGGRAWGPSGGLRAPFVFLFALGQTRSCLV